MTEEVVPTRKASSVPSEGPKNRKSSTFADLLTRNRKTSTIPEEGPLNRKASRKPSIIVEEVWHIQLGKRTLNMQYLVLHKLEVIINIIA